MEARIRKSTIDDLNFLIRLESESFPSYQRSSNQSIKRGILSNFQEVFVIETTGKNVTPMGAFVLFKYSKILRLYSIAILPEFQNKGFGDYLLKYIFAFASRENFTKIVLEANVQDSKLIDWYVNKGFIVTERMANYYIEGIDALKMELTTSALASINKTTNVIVINQPHKWDFPDINAKIISVKEYINNPIYHTNTDFRVFNLCTSYKYQSYGYYVSLLASARGQRVIPSITTILDFRLLNVIQSVTYDIEELINKSLEKEEGSNFSFDIYFGQTNKPGYASLAMKLYHLFETPLFRVEFVKNERWMIKKLEVRTLSNIPAPDLKYVYEFATLYFNKKRFSNAKLVNYKYDIAILVNPEETTPPSNSVALKKFKSAANKKGMYVQFITKSDIHKINEFDALFIRETTSVNNHTYKFSRIAYAEGLVVLDDPWSILKCSNKIYQNEIFRKHKLLTPQTIIFNKNLFDKKVLEGMNYPLVLKQPDSAFSLGVIKVEDKEKALFALKGLFKKTDMVVCQEFLYSEFDWRIGILDNTPLFACKYYMSKGHWQIYNWKGEEENNAGNSETLNIDMVPEIVLKTALKASSLIGDGLYGVDLKMIDGKVYVVEVNDNPNIDADIEDLFLKDKLYDLIVNSIYQRIEIAKNVQKINVRD